MVAEAGGGSNAKGGDGRWGREGALDQRALPPGDRRWRGRTVVAAVAAATECIMDHPLLHTSRRDLHEESYKGGNQDISLVPKDISRGIGHCG